MLSLESPEPCFSAQQVTSALVKYAFARRSITLQRSPITSELELAAKLNSPIGEFTVGEDMFDNAEVIFVDPKIHYL
jgi:hypothetical protein